LSSQKGSEDSKSEKAQQRAVVINAKSKKKQKASPETTQPNTKKKEKRKATREFHKRSIEGLRLP
jgi:hypothetical protein